MTLVDLANGGEAPGCRGVQVRHQPPESRPQQTTWRLALHHARRLRRPAGRYVTKFAGTTTRVPPRLSVGHIIVSWLGSLMAIGSLGWLSNLSHAPLMLASFGASCVLLFGYPDSHFSQPRNTIGGHVLAAAIGLLVAATMGHAWPAMAIAVATAIAAMTATRTVHPPAGSTAIIAVMHQGWTFLLLPVVAGAILLVLLSALYNNVIEHRRYPLYWW